MNCYQDLTVAAPITPGSDLREAFRICYENRYTWGPTFSGYKGRCIWQQNDNRAEGDFELSNDLKSKVNGIKDEKILKAINSQLWEVAIHRVRRSFEKTHGENTFTAGETNEVGTEIIVGGKNEGDRYRIREDIVTMVHRHIHGSVVTVYTNEVIKTEFGYLSHVYSSKYTDPSTGKVRGAMNSFKDTFTQLPGNGHWVLEERIIKTHANDDQPETIQTFLFQDLEPF